MFKSTQWRESTGETPPKFLQHAPLYCSGQSPRTSPAVGNQRKRFGNFCVHFLRRFMSTMVPPNNISTHLCEKAKPRQARDWLGSTDSVRQCRTWRARKKFRVHDTMRASSWTRSRFTRLNLSTLKKCFASISRSALEIRQALLEPGRGLGWFANFANRCT